MVFTEAKKPTNGGNLNIVLDGRRGTLPNDLPPREFHNQPATNYENAHYARLVLLDLSYSSPIPLLTEEESDIISARIGEWRRFYDHHENT